MGKVLGIKDGSSGGSWVMEQRDNFTIPRKKFKRDYYVLADDANETEDEILLSTGIPPLFYSLNGAYANGYSMKETSTIVHPVTDILTILWTVTVDFDSEIDPDGNDPPELKPPTVRWHGETEEEVLEKDAVTGDPVETAAGEPILITTPVVLPVLEIKRYEFYPFDPNTMLDYSHHTNSTTFWGAPAGSALMLPMEVDEEIITDTSVTPKVSRKYAVVTYRIKFKIKNGITEPWRARVLHHGFKYREHAAAEPVAYQDKYGNPATVNLAADGTLLPDGSPPEYLEWNRFEKANFNSLSLGPF